MPGSYDPEKRTITLKTEFQAEPDLAVTTLIHFVVHDMLAQQGFPYTHLPEAIDVAVVACGLGLPLSRLNMVNDGGSFWDPTAWEIAPKPFLDTTSIAYASAIAAWLRDEASEWIADLPSSVASQMKKSLKYLNKTNDCFFKLGAAKSLGSIETMVQLAKTDSSTAGPSSRIIALRNFAADETLTAQMAEAIDATLRSGNRDLTLHAINAAAEVKLDAADVIEELKLLCGSNDELIRAKSIFAVGQMGQMDSDTSLLAARMIESKTDFLVFCGLTALSSRSEVDSQIIQSADRGFKRALQTCNYQFVGLFAAVYQTWLADPREHFANLLTEDSPEYLQIAFGALDEVNQQFVELDS